MKKRVLKNRNVWISSDIFTSQMGHALVFTMGDFINKCGQTVTQKSLIIISQRFSNLMGLGDFLVQNPYHRKVRAQIAEVLLLLMAEPESLCHIFHTQDTMGTGPKPGHTKVLSHVRPTLH